MIYKVTINLWKSPILISAPLEIVIRHNKMGRFISKFENQISTSNTGFLKGMLNGMYANVIVKYQSRSSADVYKSYDS